MAVSTPGYEATNGVKAGLLAGVRLAVEQSFIVANQTLNTSALASPIAAVNQTFQFAISDNGATRDFEVVVNVTETTGSTTPAPAPAYTETVV